MNVIFLDIDGVICTLRSHLAFGDGLLMDSWDITVCQMIARLCEKNDCKLVISSTWRKGPKCKVYLAVYGLINFLYGTKERVSSLDKENKDWRTPILGGKRGFF